MANYKIKKISELPETWEATINTNDGNKRKFFKNEKEAIYWIEKRKEKEL